MVEYQTSARSTNIDLAFAALSDPTRRAIMDRLRDGEARVTDIAAPFSMSLNAVSKHLRTLEQAALVRRRVAGREHRFSLNPGALDGAAQWIDHHRRLWNEQLDRLEEHLRQPRPSDLTGSSAPDGK
jgi:DNA-binding transcriptional ArsR family regulator